MNDLIDNNFSMKSKIFISNKMFVKIVYSLEKYWKFLLIFLNIIINIKYINKFYIEKCFNFFLNNLKLTTNINAKTSKIKHKQQNS